MIKNTIRARRLFWGLLPGMIASSAWAQVPQNPRPDAGSLLRQYESRPTDIPLRRGVPAAIPKALDRPAFEENDVRVVPSKFRLSGVTLVSEAELQKLLAPLVAKPADFRQLQYAADLVSAYYRQQGFITARAFLPQQTLSASGVPSEVEIVVLEGRYGRVRIENKSRVRDDVVRELLPVKEGDPVRLQPVERGLLLIEDLPGARVVSSTFGPGDRTGESEYIVALDAEPAMVGQVTADNYGLRTTGRLRVGAQAVWQSPREVGDAVEGNIMSSGHGQNTGRLGYSLSLGPKGWRGAVAVSRVEYELGEEFDGLGYTGTADVAAVSVSYPLVRERSLNVTLTLGAESKALIDHNPIGEQRKRAQAYTVTLSGDEVDGFGGGGTTAWAYSTSFGRIRMANDLARAFDVNNTEGGFARYNVQVTRLQTLEQVNPGLGLQLSIRSQYAAENLESSEKMPIGGPQGVRAFPQGEAVGDRAWLSSLELRQRMSWVSGVRSWVSAFYDAGGVRVNAKPTQADGNKRLLRGYGLGWGSEFGGRYFVNGSFAWPIGEGSLDPNESDKFRAWLQVGATY